MIRAFLTTGAPIDLPAETPCLPWDDHDTRRLLLSEIRSDAPWLWSAQVPDDIAAHHQRPKGWRPRVRVETWEEEALRLRAERDAAERKLARASAFSFCEGTVTVQGTAEGWSFVKGGWDDGQRMTLDQALTRGEELEREHGYHLSPGEVLRRCKVAVEAAGWVSSPKASTLSNEIYQASPEDTNRWVAFPIGDRFPAAHRMAAVLAVKRLKVEGIDVDLSR